MNRSRTARGPLARAGGKWLAPIAAAAALLAACAPQTITDTGRETGGLYNIVLVMATAVFVGVEAAIIWNAIRYRRKRGDDELPEQIHGHTGVEVLWTAIPAVIVLALFVMSMKVLADVNHEDPNDVKLVVDVTGFQWQWKFDYYKPDPTKPGDKGDPYGVSIVAQGQFEPPTLVIPVGERVHFNLISNDVIHSFFVPEWFFKRDVVPKPPTQEPNTFEITVDPDQIGTYHGQCAELCGDFHNAMTFNLRTVTPQDFDAWIAREAKKQAKGGQCAPSGTTLRISADNIAFDTNCLAAPADQPFTIDFDNQDTGVPHNVAVYENENATKLLGGAPSANDFITGPAQTTYHIKPLPPGNYFFRCDIHPTQMTGTLVVK